MPSNLRALPLLARLLLRAASLGRPAARSTEERLRNIATEGAPVAGPVEIRWDQHQIPSISAGNERDLAVGLGMVHAHLRLVQIELMRRLARGTTAAVLGPVGVPLDHALRLMRFGAAVPAMQAALPAATRQWAEGFVAGLNHQIARAPERPYAFRLLDCAPEPWTLEDLLLISRFAAVDVSWMLFARLLRASEARTPADWARLWPELQSADTLPWPETAEEAAIGAFRGSNSAAVAASRGAGGAGLIASDPHLAIMLPPVWLTAGLHAPGLDVVGLFIPGLPIVALGRSAHLAWGGTSLHAASSELIDVAGEAITSREELIPVRGRPPARVVLRETRFGPVVSDGMLLRADRPLALRWVGHRPSDELTAMLDVMRARSLDEFRTALRPFAIPGQTMVAVEAGPSGRAGRVIAAHLPRRPNTPAASLITLPEDAWALDDLEIGAEWGLREEAIVASANDRPETTPVPVGFFFSPRDRERRMRALLDGKVSLETMRRLQLDTMLDVARRSCQAILPRLPAGRVREALAAWDGRYDAESAGALAFEVFSAELARRTVPRADLTLLASFWTGRALVGRRIGTPSSAAIRAASRAAERALRRYRNWGGVHRMTVADPLTQLPGLGRWFPRAVWGAPGGNETINKTGHGPVRGRHRVSYGACARHVSDLADPDSNWFVILGGQDGWTGSANATDQIALWRRGEAVQLSLHHPASSAYRTTLRPG